MGTEADDPLLRERAVMSGFEEHMTLVERCSAELSAGIVAVSGVIASAIARGGKLMLCGNGGSAADSQHLAAEIIGRFARERAALPALALTTDTSVITALANDYSFDDIFARQVEGLAHAGDVLLGISTSGRSRNVIKALEKAKAYECSTVALTGNGGGPLSEIADYRLIVPSRSTARIQEMHILIGHLLCDYIEQVSARAGGL